MSLAMPAFFIALVIYYVVVRFALGLRGKFIGDVAFVVVGLAVLALLWLSRGK